MLVNIDDNEALTMLTDRLQYWSKNLDRKDIEAYEKMYERYIDEGLFEGGDFNVMQIVDNDVVNWCSVIDKKDISRETWDELEDVGEGGETDELSPEAQDDLGVTGQIEVITRDRVIIRS